MMKEILVYRFEEVIHAPIDIVFNYVDDDEKIKLWNTLFIENIYDTEDGKPVYKQGTKFKTVQKIDKKVITVDSELIEYTAPNKIIMHSITKEGISISKYFLSRDYDGTKLIVEASIIPSNFYYQLMTKMFRWASKYVFEEQYNNLKTYIENEVEYE
ncbi:SRPBCC family protein [Lederbergia lenta]|uniref:Cytoplasmic protein n=2 Tax=Lederbergia lenta TaxID=1467 RepID=A0A2X4YZ49_LEDLE|nr:SRPBCC family protein [Lederbergia lenta]SQI53654.1 cytoplasmic protein [Lederbergia lenta]